MAERREREAATRARREVEDQTLCAVCLDRPKGAAFDPCGHRACLDCAEACRRRAPRRCPHCRERIARVIRVYD